MASGAPSDPAAVVGVRGLRKSYPAVLALDDINLDLRGAEVHAICGENGAGKTTLIRILSGAERPDGGVLLIDGATVDLPTPLAAHARGISTIYQELNLTPQLSAAENIFAGHLPRRSGFFVDWPALRARSREVLLRLGANFDAGARVGDLSIAQRQLVEISKALVRSSRVIIMDEPTASLSAAETAAFLGIVRRLRADGLAVLYVSHRLEEVFGIADRITVLRDGRQVASVDASDSSPADVVRFMVGRDLKHRAHQAVLPSASKPALEVRHLSSGGVFQDVSFEVMPGEIVGMYGLIGAGRTEVARAVFGLDPHESGEVNVGGTVIPRNAPRAAMRAGLIYASEDRKGIGLVLGLAVEENICMASLDKVGSHGLWSRTRARALARTFIRRLDIRPPDPAASVRSLSGGNQQKVVLAKWLATEPRVLILDEPTRGIDVGAKSEIYAIIGEMAVEGHAVVVISSELTELLAVTHRILVMRDGHLVGALDRDHATEEAVMSLATGLSGNQAPVSAIAGRPTPGPSSGPAPRSTET
jgi:ribose transport system ATP-binding protein